jgi:hypothetical protein
MSFLLFLMFSFQQIREEGGGTVSAWGWGVAQTMCTHVSKCKNDQIKK